MAARPGSERDHQIAEEQAALRRVAVLVARAAPPGEVFTAVTAEAGRLLGAHRAAMSRYDPGGTVTVVAAWSAVGAAVAIGTQWSLGWRDVQSLVFQTGRAARLDDYAEATGPAGEIARTAGVDAAVAVPISVEGRLWGVMSVASTRQRPLPADTEARLAGFTELAATTIANLQARTELRGFAAEQAALRRVATMVARAAPPEEIFAAVSAEAGRVLGADFTFLSRYDADNAATIVASWSGASAAFPAGTRVNLGGRNIHTLVFQTGQAARIDDYTDASGPATDLAREYGLRSGAGVPVSVEGRLWGVMNVARTQEQPLPADIEARLAGFTELAATAVANAQTRTELRGFAAEQAALRRVAVLVARAAPPGEVFTAVAEEAGGRVGADYTVLSRYDADGLVTVVGGWAKTDSDRPLAIGLRLKPEGRDIHTLVFETGQPARIDDYGNASGAFADVAPGGGFRSSAGAPISVEGRLWGIMIVGSQAEPLPANTETRLAGFTELAATAIANAEAQAALTASRARIVAAADDTRRRIERDLHDGAQQRLVTLALQLRQAQAAAPPGAGELAGRLERAVGEVSGALEDLLEIARGLHPAVLTERGLRPALRALARRSPIPVTMDVQVSVRLPGPAETAAYYAVSEALTNTAKHAHAANATVQVTTRDGTLHLTIGDDGRGGAAPGEGTGLVGLTDRIEALGGRLTLDSPPGAGTTLYITLPLTDATAPEQPPPVSPPG
jgi:GAF domain-containing protein